MSQVKSFYDQLQFPGHYSKLSIDLQTECLTNSYLKFIDGYLKNGVSVLDVGCGTGLTTNLFARRWPASDFVGIDFADSVDYAQQFAKSNQINNVRFIKQNFLEFDIQQKFDVVLCQGVLHHIPEWPQALEKLKKLKQPGGLLIVGLYHPAGKFLKKFTNLNYKNCTLEQDQEHNPYEISFTKSQVIEHIKPLSLLAQYPNYLKSSYLSALIKSRNGGLITYVLQ